MDAQTPVSPRPVGEILYTRYLVPLNVSPAELAVGAGLSEKRVLSVVRHHQRINASFAFRLERFLGTPSSQWMLRQIQHDTYWARHALTGVLSTIERDISASCKVRHLLAGPRLAGRCPQDILAEALRMLDLSEQDLADSLGLRVTAVHCVVSRREPMTSNVAVRLEQLWEVPGEWWLERQAACDLASAAARLAPGDSRDPVARYRGQLRPAREEVPSGPTAAVPKH
ncbi:MAG: hypothetical protein R3E10_02725 [Gemmatimonadota bacterium]